MRHETVSEFERNACYDCSSCTIAHFSTGGNDRLVLLDIGGVLRLISKESSVPLLRFECSLTTDAHRMASSESPELRQSNVTAVEDRVWGLGRGKSVEAAHQTRNAYRASTPPSHLAVHPFGSEDQQLALLCERSAQVNHPSRVACMVLAFFEPR